MTSFRTGPSTKGRTPPTAQRHGHEMSLVLAPLGELLGLLGGEPTGLDLDLFGPGLHGLRQQRGLERLARPQGCAHRVREPRAGSYISFKIMFLSCF